MFFKDKPLLVVLLLVIIIGFSITSSVNAQEDFLHSSIIEGMTNSNEDDDLPPCTNDLAPTCSSTVQDTAASVNGSYYDEDYILKTMIVPPVCPVCPSVINQHSHDGQVNSENERVGGSELQNTETNITNISNITNSSRTENNEILNEDFGISEENSILRRQNDRLQDRLDETNNSNNNRSSNGNNNSNGNGNGNTQTNLMLQQYENTINELRGEINNLQQSSSSNGRDNGSCPPCPSCERCPEPAFSCEKVINYRSPSVGQYLPMPVLGDFSTFNNN